MDLVGRIKAKRTSAARARELAAELKSPDDRMRAVAFACELEAQADLLEDQLIGVPDLP